MHARFLVSGNLWQLISFIRSIFIHAANKETAFVYALTSAAVAHAITKACSAGKLPDCACEPKYHKYYGRRLKARCDENFEYGLLFSELFVDAPDQDRQARITFRRSGQHLVNLHNSRAGRQVLYTCSESFFIFTLNLLPKAKGHLSYFVALN